MDDSKASDCWDEEQLNIAIAQSLQEIKRKRTDTVIVTKGIPSY
jgi:hypothetical protein